MSLDDRGQRLLLYAALIALAWYATRYESRAGSGTVRAVDPLSGQPISPTEYYIPPAPMIPISTSGGGGFGRF